MAYTKGELVEQIYLILTALQPTEDANIQKEDIETYIPNAINHVALVDSRNRRREARRDDVGDSGVDPAFLRAEVLPVQKDCDVNIHYAVFETSPLLMDNTYGIAEVSSVQGKRAFRKKMSKHDGDVIAYLFQGIVRWYYENYMGEERLFFENLPDVVKEVRVYYVPSSDDLGDDDIVPIPSGLETEVIQKTVELFLIGTERPADNTNNHADDRQRQ